MNIGILCYPTHGGSGVVASELGAALAERGHNVHVISYALPFRFQSYRSNLTYHEVEVSAYPLFKYPPYDLAMAGTIMEVAEANGLDLLHAHYAIPHAISGILAREMLRNGRPEMKLVTTLHGTDITIIGQQRVYKKVTSFGIARSDRVTCVSHELRSRTLGLLECDADHVEVLPNFIDVRRFVPGCCPDKRRQLGRHDEKIILHVSNFREVKRPRDMIHAFARVVGKINARLALVGDGPELAACKELVEKLGLRRQVSFIGTYDAIWELMPQADLFYLPSEYESFGLSALEAMACGVPVVASHTGGLPEVVTSGQTGILVPVGDIQVHADAMIELLSDDTKRKAFGAAAREVAVGRFALEKILPQWESLYERTLKG
ncbi:MAG TPA: N-acetyl-alpha-D-glucosaminyl L-malate synthase BshA [Planctomycetota bacterium]|nr:N-acetyl-alpha-D-glucosaminyl L-malate synthase BshA [Planctomycetota bacterium]